ncbi:MAG: helix-turn-helix transcriptional regulator [Hyphomonas sp.]
MELQKIFGSNVRQYRRAIHWTLEQLAAEVGVSRETIGKIERGISAPLFETVEKIARALGVSPLALFNATPFPAGVRGEILAEINLSLANLNEHQLSSVQRLILAMRER